MQHISTLFILPFFPSLCANNNQQSCVVGKYRVVVKTADVTKYNDCDMWQVRPMLFCLFVCFVCAGVCDKVQSAYVGTALPFHVYAK